MKKLCLVMVLALLAVPVMANQGNTTTDVNAILADQTKLKDELQSRSGRAKDLSANQRLEVVKNQETVFQVLDGAGNVADLTEDQRVRAFNALQAIEKTLAQATDERMVCERHKPTGSNRVVTTCKTVRDRQQEREHAQRQMIVGPNNTMNSR